MLASLLRTVAMLPEVDLFWVRKNPQIQHDHLVFEVQEAGGAFEKGFVQTR